MMCCFCLKGYSQQDAQEFLCELLDKIVSELERRHKMNTDEVNRLAIRISKVGLLLNVKCLFKSVKMEAVGGNTYV